ncbi:hypothetical protein GCWU000325_02403 [Alloprevotella tannerae ATCC 51259]|uniref:Uncharacterized protein n=1 Tax=Alloprevotella tannerae ATCC 51259 TaxID=626522 RepID=C9LJJ0_9BACT|nr:hypothetical protein GCWU000325_02403 [Alloprevotella tannerae ATCC 51259]
MSSSLFFINKDAFPTRLLFFPSKILVNSSDYQLTYLTIGTQTENSTTHIYIL